MKIFGVTGWKNSGKTGLVERLVAHFSAQGLTVSTIKHAHHAFDVDQPGRDSFRHRQAGAQEVLVSSGQRFALMHELRGAKEPDLETLLARLTPVDLVIIEGFKRENHPKIECVRVENNHPLIADSDENISAIASDGPIASSRPVLSLDDTDSIANHIRMQLGLK